MVVHSSFSVYVPKGTPDDPGKMFPTEIMVKVKLPLGLISTMS
jgi:hypothetical protein